MITKYQSFKVNELRREIESALRRGDNSAYKELLEEVLNRKFSTPD